MTRRKGVALFIIINTAIFLISLAYVLIFYRAEAPVACKFKEVLHMYCPGCGGTRAVYYLLRLDFANSFISNPAVIITALILADIDIRALIALIKNDSRILTSFKAKTFLVIPTVLVLNFAVRNILLYGFSIDLLGDIIR